MRQLVYLHDEAKAAASLLVPSRVPVAETLRSKGVNVYQCPVCHKHFRHDDEFEPVCTGPNETTDDHPMTVMTFVGVSPKLIGVLT